MHQTDHRPPPTPSQGTALPEGVMLRRMVESDLETAETLAREVQWPHRREDWRFGLTHGEGIVVERNGQVLATGMRWLWGKHHATLGMLIVSQALRGQSIGQCLVEVLLQGLDERSVLLHATPEARGLYERCGFRAIGDISQHQGLASPPELVIPAEGERLRPLGRNDAKALVALDTRAAGMPRDALVRHLLKDGEAVVLARGGDAVGFSVLRRFGRAYAVGPVVAPDVDGAKALIGYWCGRYAGKFVRVDVDAAGPLAGWLQSQGLERVAGGSAMVRGPMPQRGFAQGGWALVSQALG